MSPVEFSSMEDAEKKLAVKLTVDATNAINSLKEVNDATKQTKEEFKGLGETIDSGAAQAGEKVSGLTGAFNKLKEMVSSFGVIGQFVFGSILAMGAVQAFRAVTSALVDFGKEILTRGKEMSQVMFTFEVSIRALQRIGLDTTIAEWSKEIDNLKKKFPFFSRKEFIEATTLAALMTREFGFTTEQIAKLTEQAVVLAQVTGKTLTESIRGVTYAIGSGYFESLQRAGINISRQIVAQEALARGYEGSYTALSQNVRAMLTYEIIQRNISAISEDATRKIETYAGQVEILYAQWEDLKNLFGEVVTSSNSVMEILELVNDALKAIVDTYKVLAEFDIDIFAGTKGLLSFLGIDNVIKGIENLTTALQAFTNVLGALAKVAEVLNLDTVINALSRLAGLGDIINLERGLGDIEGEQKPKTYSFAGIEFPDEAAYEEFVGAFQEANEKIDEINKDGAEKRLDIEEKYFEDRQDLFIKHNQKMVDIANDLQSRLDDIETKRLQSIEDANSDYQYNLAEAARQATYRKAEAERRYREREINAEKRFQEKMRQLRENFLLSLEDAVRERDALQIIRLTRQYNLRKTQMEREEGLSGEERANAFQEELRQIEFQRQERIRQLGIEHARRLQEIELQAQRERAKAQLEYERKQEEEKARYEESKADLQERRDEQFADLDKSIQDRINKIISGLQKEFSLTKEQLVKIGNLYAAYYGPGSQFDVAIGYAIARLGQLQIMYARMRMIMGMTGSGWSGMPGVPSKAEGGIVIANKPTTVTFGEAGAEMATFTPLNRAGVNTNQVIGNLPAGVGGGGGGKYVVGISLSPGLEGKIVDQALDQASEIMFKIERARR